jgi:small subunit ribosomal protein S17
MAGKRFTGDVVSTKMQKTIVVAVDVKKAHPVYKKVVTNTQRFKARDEIGVNVGDTVLIEETRPMSKEVTWKVLEVVKEADK